MDSGWRQNDIVYVSLDSLVARIKINLYSQLRLEFSANLPADDADYNHEYSGGEDIGVFHRAFDTLTGIN
jgi:hypothetical protein